MNRTKPRPDTSGPSGIGASPWLSLAAKCALASAAGAAVLAGAALLVSGPAAAVSVVFGAALVIAFFAISLVAGHVAGRNNPSGAIGVFAVVYLLKIVGFAALLWWIGRPDWVDGPWFGGAGIAMVVIWQSVEVFAFSRLRLQIFDDPAPGNASDTPEEGHRG